MQRNLYKELNDTQIKTLLFLLKIGAFLNEHDVSLTIANYVSTQIPEEYSALKIRPLKKSQQKSKSIEEIEKVKAEAEEMLQDVRESLANVRTLLQLDTSFEDEFDGFKQKLEVFLKKVRADAGSTKNVYVPHLSMDPGFPYKGEISSRDNDDIGPIIETQVPDICRVAIRSEYNTKHIVMLFHKAVLSGELQPLTPVIDARYRTHNHIDKDGLDSFYLRRDPAELEKMKAIFQEVLADMEKDLDRLVSEIEDIINTCELQIGVREDLKPGSLVKSFGLAQENPNTPAALKREAGIAVYLLQPEQPQSAITNDEDYAALTALFEKYRKLPGVRDLFAQAGRNYIVARSLKPTLEELDLKQR